MFMICLFTLFILYCIGFYFFSDCKITANIWNRITKSYKSLRIYENKS